MLGDVNSPFNNLLFQKGTNLERPKWSKIHLVLFNSVLCL